MTLTNISKGIDKLIGGEMNKKSTTILVISFFLIAIIHSCGSQNDQQESTQESTIQPKSENNTSDAHESTSSETPSSEQSTDEIQAPKSPESKAKNSNTDQSNEQTADNPQESEGDENTIDGIALYGTHCSSCHEVLANTEKPNRSAQSINDAIAKIGVMKSLSVLSTEQVSAVADALAQ